LYDIIHYRFNDKHLIERSFSHWSFDDKNASEFEKLKLLGKQVFAYQIMRKTYEAFPDKGISYVRNVLEVLLEKNVLNYIFEEKNLKNFLQNENISRNSPVRTDILKALIGAVDIDSKGKSSGRVIDYLFCTQLDKMGFKIVEDEDDLEDAIVRHMLI